MQDFRIALMQCGLTVTGRIEENLERIDAFLRQAAARRADLAVFPETTLCGYANDPRLARERALSRDDARVEKAVALTRDHGLHCAFGFFELDGADLFNSYAVAGQGRLLGVHRKVHVPPREKGFFTPGSGFEVFELPFAKVGLSICYDNEFCESHMCLALQGAELIVMPAGWADHWEREDYVEPCATDAEVVEERRRWMHMMFGARCRDAGTYSALVNHAGLEREGPWKFVGKSMVFAPTGKALGEARAWGDDMLFADLSASLLQRYRSMDAYVLRARRPSAYRPLVDEALAAQWREQDRR